jgi:hypothetical protein
MSTGVAGTTLLAASRAFARHAHAGEPITRDLHTLRGLHALCDEAARQTASPSKHERLLASQRDTLLVVERARASWRQRPGLGAIVVLRRADLVLTHLHAPVEVAAHRPGLLTELERSTRDASDALLTAPGEHPALEAGLGRLTDGLSRRSEDICRERERLTGGALIVALHKELEAALEAAETTNAAAVLVAALAADRVLEVWRQLVRVDPRPPHGGRVRRASTRIARTAETRRQWETGVAEYASDLYAPVPDLGRTDE